jgi:hypothetical protein
MIYKIFNEYNIFTFDKDQFADIISNITTSRGYLCYIDPNSKTGKENPRYVRYLREKQATYTMLVPKHAKTEAPISIQTVISNADITNDRMVELGRVYGIDDDYYYDYEIVHGDITSSYIATHKVKLIEESCFERAMNLENIIQGVSDRYLNESYAWNVVRRFMLLPFIAKYDGRYVEPVIIATVYDVGIMTLQVIIPFDHERMVSLSETPPNGFELEDIRFYDVKTSYTTEDFWPKSEFGNAKIGKIMKNYNKYLDAICGVKLAPFDFLSQYAWVFGDLNYRKPQDHDEYIKDNARVLLGHLQNSMQQRSMLIRDKEVEDQLNEATTDHTKISRFFCSKQFVLLSFGSKMFHDHIEKHLEPIRNQLIKDNLYDQQFKLSGKELVYNSMFEYLRFYELTFVKKFFATRLLRELASSTYTTLEEFNIIRKDMNFLMAKYDDAMIFQTEGSPKELYNKILEKTGTNEVVHKVQGLVNNVREDINQSREFVIKERDLFTTILTSTLAVLFGFAGLKNFIDNGFIHLPWIGDIIQKHPLRWTFGLWFAMFIALARLNWTKYKSYKK